MWGQTLCVLVVVLAQSPHCRSSEDRVTLAYPCGLLVLCTLRPDAAWPRERVRDRSLLPRPHPGSEGPGSPWPTGTRAVSVPEPEFL